jgi:hypothetical protein
MAEPRKKHSDIERKLINTVFSDDFELRGFGAGHLYKAEKNTSEDDKEVKKKISKPAKTPFKQWARDWQEGDALPFMPPGKILQLDSLGIKPNKKPLFRDADPTRKRSLNEIGLMSSKSVLGRTINNMPGAMQIIAMVAKRRGIPVDDQGKLRCPAGTPAANQFTDLQMSNCMVPSAATAAREAAGTVRGAVGGLSPAGSAIVGSVSIGGRVVDADGDSVYGALEAAQRFLMFKKRRAAREKLVSQLFGNFRSNAGAKKALLRAFPKMDKESLDKFLNDFNGLSGQDLADYLDMREAFIGSLLYEASKNREAAETAEIVWEFGEELLSEGEGFQVQIETGEDAQPFVLFRYSPIGLVNVKNNIQENHLANGTSNDPDNPQNASDFGSYVGTHEFFHLADFHETFKKLGLDINDTNYDSAIEKIDNIINGDVNGALSQGLITPEQHALWNLHEKLKSDIASGVSNEDALDSFYEEIAKFFTEGTGLYTPEVAAIMKDVVGSKYGHQSNIENKAELGAAASYFPELLQQRIDEINEDRIINGIPPIPDLDELMKDMFGGDVITPPSQNTQIQRPGVARRTVRAARALKNPDGQDSDTEDVSDIDDAAALDYLIDTAGNIKKSNLRRQKNIRKMSLDLLFDAYTEDEIKNILASIPVSQRGNNRYITSLLKVPERFSGSRTPSGSRSPRELDWLDLLARADNEGWIDFTTISDMYTLRGGGSPMDTAKANVRALRRSVQQRREDREQRATTKAQTRKLTGSMGNPRLSKVSGSMAWVRRNGVRWWEDEPKNNPKPDSRVSASIKPLKDGKISINWGDESWEFDSSKDVDKQWKEQVLKDWAKFDGNFSMRYVSSMLMGMDVPDSSGYNEEKDDGSNSIHDALVSGKIKGLDDKQKAEVKKAVEQAVIALLSIEKDDNVKDYDAYRGLSGVNENASILKAKVGDEIEMPLSAFTPSKNWASEMAEFNDEGEGVLIHLLPGAHSTAADEKVDKDSDEYWANAFEVVSSGRFEVVKVDSPDNEPTVVTLRQTAVFDPKTSQFKAPSRKLSGSMSSGEKKEAVQRTNASMEERAKEIGLDLKEKPSQERVDKEIDRQLANLEYYKEEAAKEIKLPDRTIEFIKAQVEAGQFLTSSESDSYGRVNDALQSILMGAAQDPSLGLTRDGGVPMNLRLEITKQMHLARGDSEAAKKVDDFREYLRTASPQQLKEDLANAGSSYGRSIDRHVVVQTRSMKPFAKGAHSILTHHDLEEKEKLGIQSMNWMGDSITSSARMKTEANLLNIPMEDTADIRALRPSSGYIVPSKLTKARVDRFKKIYGDDVKVMHELPVGAPVSAVAGKVVKNYGGSSFILRPEVAERTRVYNGDTVDVMGNEPPPINLADMDQEGIFLSSALGLLYDYKSGETEVTPASAFESTVDDGSGRRAYKEALVLGRFKPEEIEAIAAPVADFRKGVGEGSVRGMNLDFDANLSLIIDFAQSRDEMLEQYGIELIPLLNFGQLSTENVELFNPSMSKGFFEQLTEKREDKPDINDYVTSPETTPYEVWLKLQLDTLKGGNSPFMEYRGEDGKDEDYKMAWKTKFVEDELERVSSRRNKQKENATSGQKEQQEEEIAREKVRTEIAEAGRLAQEQAQETED